MATDRNLIAGAARLADAESAMSIGIGAGLAQEALRIQQDIVQKTNERRSILRQDMNNAATFIGRMQTLDNVTGQYHDVLTERGIYTRDELNRIAEDTSLSSAQKIAEYSRLTNEYNALASNFTRDQQKLIGLQNSVAQGLTSETLNFSDPDVAIARQLGTGEYEITKDGYNVTYDIDGKKTTVLVKSQELDKYISKYSIKDLEGLTTLQDNYVKEIANAKGDTQLEGIIQKRFELLPVEDKLKLLVDLGGNSYINYIDKETNELNVDHINAEFKKYAAGLTDQFGYTPTPEEKKDLFSEMLTQRAEDGIKNLQNYGNYVGIKYAGYPITAMGLEANPDSDDFGKIKIIQRIGGENVVTYRNADDVEFMRDMYTRKLLDQAEGKDERNRARVIANTYFDTFLEIRNEQNQETADDIKKIYEDNPDNLTEANKTFINNNKELFPDIVEDQQSLINTEKEATTTKMSRPQKERLRENWLIKVKDGDFNKYLQDNNIPKEGAINEKTGMVKSTIVNRPDFKEAFGNEYPANTYRDGSKIFGTMQSEFYGQDFVRTPGGRFTKRTRTEVEGEIESRRQELLGKADKADRAKYFRKSSKDLSAYDQLAKNDENIPKLSAEDFESFIDTGELDDKYVNIILNNKDKFSSTLIDLIQKNFK